MNDYALICIGGSWGGFAAVGRLLQGIPAGVDVPIALALHRAPDSLGLARLLQKRTHMTVVEAEDKQPIVRGTLYLAPPDYHLLVEEGALALSVDARVQYARPSIDVLFESAADSYGDGVIGIVVTGANTDGARGLAAIKAAGGVAIVQSPAEAERRTMPDAAIATTNADAVLPLDDIGKFLFGLTYAPRIARSLS